MSYYLFKDSFDRYKVGGVGDADLLANLLSRYTTYSGTLNIVNTGATGQCLSSSSGNLTKTVPHSATWVLGFMFQYNVAHSDSVIFALSNNGSPLLTVVLNADSTLTLRAGTLTGTAIATTDRSLFASRWYSIEISLTLSGSSPISVSAELRINGHVEASGSGSTGVNASSLPSQDATANVFGFGQLAAVGGVCLYDNFYIKNESGYLGDERVFPVYPNGDGATLNWTPNSGTVHYDRVNTHPVDLTKWLETATPGDIDLWDFEDCPAFSGSLLAVNISVLARKDDEGTKSFKIVCASAAGAVEAESDEFFVSDTTSEYYEWSLKLDPATGLAWTQAGFNAKQFGVKLIS